MFKLGEAYTSAASYPMAEIKRRTFGSADKVYEPSFVVVVPRDVPFCITDGKFTPITQNVYSSIPAQTLNRKLKGVTEPYYDVN